MARHQARAEWVLSPGEAGKGGGKLGGVSGGWVGSSQMFYSTPRSVLVKNERVLPRGSFADIWVSISKQKLESIS